MITRLRPLPSSEELAVMYAVPHDHRLYGRGHGERVDATIRLALENIPHPHRADVADLSCGNAAIPLALWTGGELFLGDAAAQLLDVDLPGTKFHGPLEKTLALLPRHVDVYVLSETLEHVDDPHAVLRTIRACADSLVLSTPLECWDDANAEHLWAWDREDVETLLVETGWRPRVFTSVDSRVYGEPYLYGIWVTS